MCRLRIDREALAVKGLKAYVLQSNWRVRTKDHCVGFLGQDIESRDKSGERTRDRETVRSRVRAKLYCAITTNWTI